MSIRTELALMYRTLPLSTTSFKAFMISSLSQSDNHVTITPSAKLVDTEIVC
jgi:hypothetical protein